MAGHDAVCSFFPCFYYMRGVKGLRRQAPQPAEGEDRSFSKARFTSTTRLFRDITACKVSVSLEYKRHAAQKWHSRRRIVGYA